MMATVMIDLVGVDIELVNELGKGPAQDMMDLIKRHVLPIPVAACKCSHPASDHYGGDGRCYAASVHSDETCTCEAFAPVAPDPGLREAIARRMFADADAIAVEHGDRPVRWEDYEHQDWYYRRAESAMAVLAERGVR